MKSKNRTNRVLPLRALAAIALVLGVTVGILVNDHTVASAKNGEHHHDNGNKIAEDLRGQLNGQDDNQVKIILQLNGRMSGSLNALLNSNGVRIRKQFANFNTFSLDVPLHIVNSLATYSEVGFISIDSDVQGLGHITHTTGADNTRSMSTDGTLDGSGVGIAIVDSGIFASHSAFTDTQTGRSRIVVSQDFTGEGRTDDPYGHGTHVAAAAAGNGLVANGEYTGIAPRASIINLRVLNSHGVGSVSSLLGALNWLMDNAATYNVRVVNLSLGLPAVNSYKNDPICLAVRRLVDRGIIVVAAAGNNGKDSNLATFRVKYFGTCKAELRLRNVLPTLRTRRNN